MVRNIHDTFAKEWMESLLADFGTVETERQVVSEVRKIDLVFYPRSDVSPSLSALGLLGRMLCQPCPIEFFRNPVPAKEIVNCRDKAADLRAQWRREGIENQSVSDRLHRSPLLWIISPTFSERMQSTFRVKPKPGWGEGIYFLPENDLAAIVVVHQLPVNIDTLWLRLLGRGKVQARAVQEVLALPEDYPYRLETLRHLTQLRLYLEMRQNKSRDLKEVIMNISAAYEEWETKTIAKGVKLGEKLGEKRGERRGKKRGVELGDTAARLEIAQQLLADSMPIEKVANLTKLSLEQIQAIGTQS